MEFEPRPFQSHILKNEHRFQVAVIHRRAGKTVAAAEWLTQPVTDWDFEGLPPYRGYYACPLQSQAMDNVWQYLVAACEKAADATDDYLYVNRSKCLIVFQEAGHQIQCIGTEHNPDRHRGKYMDRVVLDETAQIAPSWWRKVARPALADREGQALFIGTVNGRDWFHDLYKLGGDDEAPNWDSIMLKASESGLLEDVELTEIRKEIGERAFATEMECDFDVPPLGALFAKEAMRIPAEHVRPIHHDPRLPCYTSWHFANQSISVAVIQPKRGDLNVLRFERWASIHLADVVKTINAWPYVYSEHFGGGKLSGYTDSRIEVLNNLHYTMQISELSKVPEDNWHEVRSILPRCAFNVRDDDQPAAEDLLEAVRTAAVRYFEDTDTYGSGTDDTWQLEAVMCLVHFARSYSDQATDWSKPVDYAVA